MDGPAVGHASVARSVPRRARLGARSMSSDRLWRAVRRITATCVLLLLLTAAAISAHALWLDSLAGPPPPAETIVVLGGGVLGDGSPGPDTLRRTRQGIALWQAGAAPRILFTGGHRNPDLPGLADGMAVVALEAGLPESAISRENVSRSTLQNALFSADALPPGEAAPIILVSDGYHLARAWVSFRWAGFEPVGLSAASAFGGGDPRDKVWRVGRETLAWWFNAGRLALWSAMDAVGIGHDTMSDMLA